MVVQIPVNGGPPGPTGEFQRPGGARFEPGYGTHAIIPNRNAKVTVEVGPPVYPIDSVHKLLSANYLQGPGFTGGEVVVGTGIVATPTANDAWISRYDNSTFGRNSEDQFAGTSVPMWAPTYPMPVEQCEDRS